MQINHITQKEYSGANQDSLAHAQSSFGFSANEWMTFIQARNAGRKVKKGAKGIVLARVVEYENRKKNSKIELKKAVRKFVVFNLEQTEVVA